MAKDDTTGVTFTCLDLLAEKARKESGMEAARVDHGRGEVEFAFNPAKVSEAAVREAAVRLGPAMQASLRRSVVHLTGRVTEKSGARTARELEAHVGVRRAIASYVGGTVSITFDPGQVDEGSLLEDAVAQGLPVESEDEMIAEKDRESALRHGSTMERLRYWLSGDRFERILVGLALFTMILGAVVEHNAGMSWLAVLLYLASYLSGGSFGTISAYESLRHGDVDIDLLMILAALGAAAVGAPFEGAMLLFLFAFSNVLQTYAMGRTRNAIEALARLRPQTAHVRRDGGFIDLPLAEIAVGDEILLRPGEQIPLDAEVIEGESSVDQSSITGESMPVNKFPGETLFAGTQNQVGGLTARVTRAAKDSTLARMIALVEEAQARKANTQRFLEDTEKRYAIGVIGFTLLLTFTLPTVFGLSWSEGFYRAITVMVVASPCALVISTPASILSAIANAARQGILFKGGAQLEKAARIQTIAFDKTGTLTQGRPKVVDTWCGREEMKCEELLALTAALEQRSEHPLAKAIVDHAKERGLALPTASGFSAQLGRGVSGTVRGHRLVAGSAHWVSTQAPFPTEASDTVNRWLKQGRTVIATMMQKSENEEGFLLGLFAIADPVRPESAEVIQTLHRNGIRRIAMLTGDNRAVAQSIAAEIGLDEVYADLLPTDKVRLLKQIAEDEEIAMVGDGTNDAPALASASLGIAMGAAGSDIAMESADVVLMANDLRKIPYVLGISRAARKVVAQNLVFAGGIIVLMVLATLLVPVLAPGYAVPLPFGVLAHEGGTVLVCLNGLRLLVWKP